MSKIVKIKQAQIEQIVSNLISEHLDEIQSNMPDNEITEEPSRNVVKCGIAIGPDGRHYVINVETGEILGSK
jgi:hypothetical protein